MVYLKGFDSPYHYLYKKFYTYEEEKRQLSHFKQLLSQAFSQLSQGERSGSRIKWALSQLSQLSHDSGHTYKKKFLDEIKSIKKIIFYKKTGGRVIYIDRL